MKKLLLMRHGKSSMDEKEKDDYDRQLTKRGRKNSPQMGEFLKDEKLVPEYILSSTATRARQTADLVMEAMKYRGDVCFLNSLYMAEVDVLLKAIQDLPEHVTCVLVVGHNPGLDSLLQMVTRKVETLATAAVAYVELPIDSWKDFSLETEAELLNLWRPKDL